MSFTKTWAASRKTRATTGYRSGLEVALADHLNAAHIDFDYETLKIPYIVPALYLPDFILREQAIVIETKGAFASADRSKMLRVKAEHPHLDIRFLFSNPNTRIGTRSRTSYGAWCTKHGFPFGKGGILPQDWMTHTPTSHQREALENLINGKRIH